MYIYIYVYVYVYIYVYICTYVYVYVYVYVYMIVHIENDSHIGRYFISGKIDAFQFYTQILDFFLHQKNPSIPTLGAHIGAYNDSGETPLHMVAAQSQLVLPSQVGRCVEAAKLLLHFGADVNRENARGHIPLQTALLGRGCALPLVG